MSDFHITNIALQNFRAFKWLELDFHSELTVLVGLNGRGKTAVLDALAIALRAWVEIITEDTSHGFERSDMRLARSPDGQMVEQPPTILLAEAQLDGKYVSWQRELTTLKGRTRSPDSQDINDEAQRLKVALRMYADRKVPDPPNLPLIAYYGTGRLWSKGRISSQKRKKATRFDRQTDAYLDCLNPSSSFGNFALWFEAVSREAQRVPSPDGERAQDYLSAVQGATDLVLKEVGWHSLAWNFLTQTIVAEEENQGELPVSLLSDGIRNAIALVADIAHRCVRLNPHFREQAALQTSGVVLIDEVDMHLHPSWQQTILHSLKEAFPKIQFVVTTHSPQVLSVVPAESIRLLEDEVDDRVVPRPPRYQTEGIPSSDVLALVMGVDPRAETPIRTLLDQYRALLEDGMHDSEAAQGLLATLTKHFGESHPEILDLQRLARLRSALARESGRKPK